MQHGPAIRWGEVYWITLTGQGSEQRGRRPAVIVQNDAGNRTSPTTIIAIISSGPPRRLYPFMVELEAGEANLTRTSYVNCAHVYTVDQGRLENYQGTLSEAKAREVAEALRFELAL